jgi:hypothetical protein
VSHPSPQRVAHRWLLATPELTFKWPHKNMLLMLEDGERIGHLKVYPETPMPELLAIAQCPKSLQTLYDKYGEGPVVKGWVSEVVWAKRKQGSGLQMYERAIRDLKRRHSGGFYFIPSMCGKRGEGSSTHGAQALWKALARQHPSAGMCLYIT